MEKYKFTVLVSGVSLLLASTSALAVVSDSLLTDSNVTSDWLDCAGSTLVSGSDENFDEEHLSDEGCAYRLTDATAEETYKLTCGVSSLKYSSITLAFQNDNGETLATETTEIFENVDGAAYSVELLAPANTTTAAVGIYGLAGTGFQDCALQLSNPTAIPVDGSIVGTTWFDENDNGVRDTGESVIQSNTADLLFEGVSIEQTTTNAKGQYFFYGLDIDNCYQVQLTPADATLQVTSSGEHNVADITGLTPEVCLTETVPNVVQNVGYKAAEVFEEPADNVVCGRTWFTDGDGTDREYLSGVKAFLTNQATSEYDVLYTDDTGRYVFENLVAGDYRLWVIAPDGYTYITGDTATNAASSFVNENGKSAVITLPQDRNTGAANMCTFGWANAGLNKTAVALDPTVANDDEITGEVGESLYISVADNDAACNAEIEEVTLIGHNVPGEVTLDTATGEITILDTTETGTYSIEYGLRGTCGSYDTAEVSVTIEEVVVVDSGAPASIPFCYASIGTEDSNADKLHIDLLPSTDLAIDDFASSFNLYDEDMVLMSTVLNADAVRRTTHLAFKNGIHGIDALAVKYVTAVENGLESAPTECIIRNVTPIALDVDRNGHVETIAGTFSFDIDGNGVNENLGEWFSPSDGILINKHFGKVMSGEHLFGDVGGQFADGFSKLALEDANQDGQLSGDELQNLAIWIDSNSNAMVDAAEVTSLDTHFIESLSVDHYKYTTRASLKDGSTMLMRDLWFSATPINQASK